MATPLPDYVTASLGDLPLESGGFLNNAQLAYKIFGDIRSQNPLIVYPTSFGTHHTDLEWLIGPGKALDPDRYVIVMINLFGSGLSTSPSTYGEGVRAYPHVTMADNVRAQHHLISAQFGRDHVHLVVGFSMGAQAAFHWGALFPEYVARIAPICGAARTSHHNYVFLEGVKHALIGDPAWKNGWFEQPPRIGFKAMGRVYAGWALSQAFYREEIYRGLGFASLEDYLKNEWDNRFGQRDAHDLLAMIWTWQNADISANAKFNHNLSLALSSITAQALIMPSTTDLYFTFEDSRREAEMMPNAVFRPIPTLWGHRVNVPTQNPQDAQFIDASLSDFLAR